MPTNQEIALTATGVLAATLLARKLLLSAPAKLPPNPALCITGCDMGIANETVKQIAAMNRGFTVYAGCLTEKGAADLNALNLPNVHTFLLDVSQDSSVNSMKHLFESDYCSPSSNRNLFALFNIAGILRGFLAELSTIEDWKQVYEVNVFGVWRCCVALLPLIRETAKKFPGREGYAYPRIVTITSVVAELVFPGGSVYNSSKHAACGLLSTLRLELEDQGIKVVQVQPWFVNSAFFNVLNAKEADKIRERTPTEVLEVYGGEKALKAVDKDTLTKMIPMLLPADVASAMINEALLPANPAAHVVIGGLGKFMLGVRRWLPLSWSDRLLNLKQ